MRLELVLEAVQGGDLSGETLTLSDASNDLITELALSQGVTLHELPVVEHALGEGLAGGGGAEGTGETCAVKGSTFITDRLDNLTLSITSQWEGMSYRRTRPRAGRP